MRQCLIDTYAKDQLDEMGDLRLRVDALDLDDLLAATVLTKREYCTTPRSTTLYLNLFLLCGSHLAE